MAASEVFKPSSYPPSKTALLLLDYQNALISMIEAGTKEKVVGAAKSLLKAARQNNVTIVHCLADCDRDPPAANKTTKDWASVHKPWLSSTPSLADEYHELAVINEGRESTSLRAPGYRSALVGDGLVSFLREKLGVGHLILGGIATSGAVLGTATHATDLDFVVTVVEDACWDPKQEVHRSLIDHVIPSLAWVSTVEEAVGYMTG